MRSGDVNDDLLLDSDNPIMLLSSEKVKENSQVSYD